MTKSGYKCVNCRGCMQWHHYGPNKYLFCSLCNKMYKLYPGGTAKEVDLKTFMEVNSGEANEVGHQDIQTRNGVGESSSLGTTEAKYESPNT